MKEKEKKGELGYEGISWTKSRVRRYKLDEVQEKKMEEQAGQSPDIKKNKRERKKRRTKLDEVQRGEWSKTGIMIA